jgi:purine-binding chemotaxis protein CheW
MKQHDHNAENFILFQIADTSYAVPSVNVLQMEMIENITPVPNAAPYVEGVVFTRGQVIPAVSLRTRFGFERVPHTPRSRLIVTACGGRVVGLIADSAREFVSIPIDAVKPPPNGLSGVSGNYLRGIVTIDDRIILIVNIAELIDAVETQQDDAHRTGGIYGKSKPA